MSDGTSPSPSTFPAPVAPHTPLAATAAALEHMNIEGHPGRRLSTGEPSLPVPSPLLASLVSDILLSSRAYDILPASSKVLLFDVDIPLRLSYYSLVEHDVPCAFLWDEKRGELMGAISNADLADVLRVFHVPGTTSTAAALTEFTIAAWRAFANSTEGLRRGLSNPSLSGLEPSPTSPVAPLSAFARGHVSDSSADGDITMSGAPAGVPTSSSNPAAAPVSHRPNPVPSRLISIHPEDNLLVVVHKMLNSNIHHIPVLDPEQNALIGILSYKNLLMHLVEKYTDPRGLMDIQLAEMKIGSYGPDILVVPTTASVISVLNVLAEKRISSVPVVSADSSRVVVDIYGRDDVSFLALDPTLMILDAPVGDVLDTQKKMVSY